MKIAIGCDHGGFELKNEIKNHLVERGFAVEDFGITELHKVDYPEIAVKVAHAVADGKCDRGILVCGTGIGLGSLYPVAVFFRYAPPSAPTTSAPNTQDFITTPTSFAWAAAWSAPEWESSLPTFLSTPSMKAGVTPKESP